MALAFTMGGLLPLSRRYPSLGSLLVRFPSNPIPSDMSKFHGRPLLLPCRCLAHTTPLDPPNLCPICLSSNGSSTTVVSKNQLIRELQYCKPDPKVSKVSKTFCRSSAHAKLNSGKLAEPPCLSGNPSTNRVTLGMVSPELQV